LILRRPEDAPGRAAVLVETGEAFRRTGRAPATNPFATGTTVIVDGGGTIA
jgi:hypothetical protein